MTVKTGVRMIKTVTLRVIETANKIKAIASNKAIMAGQIKTSFPNVFCLRLERLISSKHQTQDPSDVAEDRCNEKGWGVEYQTRPECNKSLRENGHGQK